jgi:uncharacterized protein (DUF885 family)
MVSMFGPIGQDPTAAMIKAGFSAGRADIADLAASMNKQFQAVEAGIETLNNIMNIRFVNLEQQMNALSQQLLDLSQTIKNNNDITDDALAAGPHPVSTGQIA